jgi:ATP/maltotriose-dependent transcriptional regulator MalT
VDEVLSAQPASIRDMLLQTSILNCVSADLASELTGDEPAADAPSGSGQGKRVRPSWIPQVLRRDPELAHSCTEQLDLDRANPAAISTAKGQTPTGQAMPLVIERLSEREREVLTDLSGMLSTADIATEMYFSVNTVKTHLRSIYRKLSAAHRSKAVRRARQLDLI